MKQFYVGIFAVVILPMLVIVNDVFSGDNTKHVQAYTTQGQCPANECIFLPLILNGIPEVDLPPRRWDHTPGQPLGVTYKYLGELNDTSHVWRLAFAQGAFTWNNTGTLVTLYLYGESENTIAMDDDQAMPIGYSVWVYTQGTNEIRVEVYGNYFWDNFFQWTENQRRSIASHELGHLQLLGHIPTSYSTPSLMYNQRTNEDREIYYVPQPPDISLVNQVYP